MIERNEGLVQLLHIWISDGRHEFNVQDVATELKITKEEALRLCTEQKVQGGFRDKNFSPHGPKARSFVINPSSSYVLEPINPYARHLAAVPDRDEEAA